MVQNDPKILGHFSGRLIPPVTYTLGWSRGTYNFRGGGYGGGRGGGSPPTKKEKKKRELGLDRPEKLLSFLGHFVQKKKNVFVPNF